jgi:hypothetical protein
MRKRREYAIEQDKRMEIKREKNRWRGQKNPSRITNYEGALAYFWSNQRDVKDRGLVICSRRWIVLRLGPDTFRAIEFDSFFHRVDVKAGISVFIPDDLREGLRVRE